MKLSVINRNNSRLQLTNNNDYIVTAVDGLNPPASNINMTKLATADGSIINSVSIEKRNIVITLYINGDIEANRIALYRFFQPKQWIKVEYKNDTRDLAIEGYVETFEGTFFAQRESFQISIMCPNPNFSARLSKTVSDIYQNAEPTTVINDGDISCGIVAEIAVYSGTENPAININGKKFMLNFTATDSGTITVNTKKGEKSVFYTVNGVSTNLINAVDADSEWVQLEAGENSISIETADYTSADMTITFTEQYIGG